jgi:16S rRNA (cytidine1402-2'-O)-methyltransferase
MTAARHRARVAVMSNAIRTPQRPQSDGRPRSTHERQIHERQTLRRYALGGQSIDVKKLAAGLHIVATPIGNLGDITLRALEALAGADLIACEDTRVTRKLLDRYAITTPLTPYHEHNAAQARPVLLGRLADGAAVALVSDAGTPLISDPGFKLVRAVQEAGHAVTALPGASAVLTALAVAGLPTDQFLFVGFLPPKQAARRSRIAEFSRIPATLVLFESGPRVAATLADLAAGLGNREAAVCRELTKMYEEIRRGDLAALAQACAESEPRGEIVLVVAPPQALPPMSVADTETLLREALTRVSVKDAVAEVAGATGLPRREVYQRALALAKGDKEAKDGREIDHGATR